MIFIRYCHLLILIIKVLKSKLGDTEVRQSSHLSSQDDHVGLNSMPLNIYLLLLFLKIFYWSITYIIIYIFWYIRLKGTQIIHKQHCLNLPRVTTSENRNFYLLMILVFHIIASFSFLITICV